jgi:glycosyltransferase involved in cell wall biosynthesis
MDALDRVPQVSIVLTTYNRAHVLATTIDSVLQQTFKNFELLICDDCSTDETRTIVEEYCERDCRIVYMPSSERLRMPNNLNRGLRAAKGSYVANLHDGDIYDEQLIAKWVSALEACPKAGFVFNAYRDAGEWFHPGTVMSVPLKPCSPGDSLLRIFDRRWRFNSPVWGTVMARKSAYQAQGFLDARYGFVADVDMWLRFAEKYNVAYVPEPLISLPTRQELPRKISSGTVNEHRMFHAMMKASRRRRSSTFRQAVKNRIVHGLFVVADFGYLGARAALGPQRLSKARTFFGSPD